MNANDSFLEMFIYENVQLTDRLDELLMEGERNAALSREAIDEIFRIMHTIKGSAAMMGYTSMATLGHAVEDMFYFIREHEDCQPDWKAIMDLCLRSTDSFRAEVSVIQGGGEANAGDDSGLLNDIQAYSVVLSGGAERPPESEEEFDAATFYGIPASSSSSRPGFLITVRFEEDCKMENIRAFQIVNGLQGLADEIISNPPDLLEDCSDQIAKDGVELIVYTALSMDEIKSAVNEAMFVDSYSIAPLEADPSDAAYMPPAADSAPIESAPPPVAPEPVYTPPPAAPAAPPRAAPAPAAPPSPPRATPAAQSGADMAPEIKQNYISVNVTKLDKLMDLMGELVISVAMVTRSPDLNGLPLPNFEKAANQLAKNTDELQEIITSVRMLPVSSTFHKMHRIVRDLSHKTGKQVELQIAGEETEVDKTIIENLTDPLMHILRNSVDHGLEDNAEARIAAGKKPMGTIKLEARNAGSDVIINISDDGKGLNRDAIAAKAVRQGLVMQSQVETMPDKEVYQFIMLPGFSTNEQVTELSGRGVGMDVVNKNIENISGTVILDSEPGKGLTVTIKIPSSLAILAGMEVAVGNARYIIPTLSIKESQKPQPEQIITDPDGNEMFLLRGEVFPITRLHSVFSVYDAVTDFTEGIMLTCEDEGRTVCLFVDELIGEQQVVQKPIPQFITQRIGAIQGVSGCTILGNGAINLIINPKDFL